jgi:hypothetical protein
MIRHPRARHVARRPRRRGQALVETALTAPMLVMLLLGGAQVGQIAYDQVSLDTAAREGARAGVAAPNAALKTGGNYWYTSTTTTPSHQCTSADFTLATANPICFAALNGAGYLTPSAFTSNPCSSSSASACITISVRCVSQTSTPCTSLAALRAGPPPARLVSNTTSCNTGNQAEVDGTVSGIPSGLVATLSDSAGDTAVTNITGTYQYCVTATSQVTTETITAHVGSFGCGGYSGSVQLSVVHGSVYPDQNITVTPNTCTTSSTTSSTSTTTTTGTGTTTSSSSSTTATTNTGTLSNGPSASCTPPPSLTTDFYNYYFTVKITYPAPVFVPFINGLFQTGNGYRTISTSVTYAINPCTMTNGA